jgi:DNA-binding NarL/FixJ family response regulator
LRALSPECKVCILSMHAKVYFVTEAFKAGASAYLLKESAAEILVDAVRIVLAGQRYIDPALINKVFAHSPLLNPAAANPNSLSKRDEEVLRLVAQGFTTKTIGEALHISPKTVEKHRSKILERLGLHNSVELVRYAVEVGLISLNE